MSSYGLSYKPFRINYSKCGTCPPPEIITDSNGNDKHSFLKTKKSRCGYILKLGLYNHRNPFRFSQSYNVGNADTTGAISNCNSLNNEYTNVDGSMKNTGYR